MFDPQNLASERVREKYCRVYMPSLHSMTNCTMIIIQHNMQTPCGFYIPCEIHMPLSQSVTEFSNETDSKKQPKNQKENNKRNKQNK